MVEFSESVESVESVESGGGDGQVVDGDVAAGNPALAPGSAPGSGCAQDGRGGDQGVDVQTDADADATDAPVTELVHRLHRGEMSTASLPVEVRRQCVEYLALDGFSNADIAQLMQISERTIRRDREAARRAGALPPDRKLGDELLGEFERVMHASMQRLARLARESETPAYARLWAEEAIVRNYQRFIQTAHRLRYLAEGGARLAQQSKRTPEEEEKQFKDQIRKLERMVRGPW